MSTVNLTFEEEKQDGSLENLRSSGGYLADINRLDFTSVINIFEICCGTERTFTALTIGL